jgi:hypothetical protein
MRKDYAAPQIRTEKSFETNALACGKTTDPPPGSYHFTQAYDTFTGHLGSGFSGSESVSGSEGIGYGGGTSLSYSYAGLCANWITYTS